MEHILLYSIKEAIDHCNLEMLKYLIEEFNFTDFDSLTDNHGYQILFRITDFDMFRYLFEIIKPDINKDTTQGTLFQAHILRNSFKICKFLIENGANIKSISLDINFLYHQPIYLLLEREIEKNRQRLEIISSFLNATTSDIVSDFLC